MNVKSAVVVFTLSLVCATSVRAAYYWRGGVGNERNWNATDNAANTTYGTWWSTSSTSGWTTTPNDSSGIVYLTSGGTCVLDADVSQKLQRLFVCGGVHGGTESTLRIEDGAVLEEVGICVSGPSSYTAPSAHLIVNGGDLSLGAGPSGYVYGLQVGYSKLAGATGTVDVTGGTIKILKGDFSIGTAPKSAGEMTVSGGTIDSLVNYFSVGGDYDEQGAWFCSTNPATDHATYVQTGGSVFVTNGSVRVRASGSVDVRGGTFVTKKLSLLKGGRFRTTDGSGLDDATIEIGSEYDKNVPGVTNVFEFAGAQTCYPKSFSFTSASPLPSVLRVTGGTFKLLGSQTVNNRKVMFDIADGTFWIEKSGGYGNLATGGQPYFMRVKGTGCASAGTFAASNYQNVLYKFQDNVLMEHVIDAHGCGIVETRNSSAGGTSGCGDHILGTQRLRPEGGFQVVSTNRFALFHMRSVKAPNVTAEDTVVGGGVTVLTSVPDATLWTTKKLADYYWGCEFNAAAEKALVKSGDVYTANFEATPMGYFALPSVKTNGLYGAQVGLKVSAPEKVAADLVAAGYTNVVCAAAAQDYNVTFTIAPERFLDRSPDQKVVFDFTETPIPAEGLNKTVHNFAYPAVTNALLSAVRVEIDREKKGMVLIFR